MIFLSLTRTFGEGMKEPLTVTSNGIVYDNLVLPPRSAMVYETEYTEDFAKSYCGARTYCIPTILCGKHLPKGVGITSTETLYSHLFLTEEKDLPMLAKCVLVNKSDREARVKIQIANGEGFRLNLERYLLEMNNFLQQTYSIEFLDDVNKYLFARGKTSRETGLLSAFPDAVFSISRDRHYDKVLSEFCINNLMLKPGEALEINCDEVTFGKVKEQAYFFFHNKKLYSDHCKYELILFFQLLLLFRLHYNLDKEANDCKTCGSYYLESIPKKSYNSSMIKDENGNLIMKIVNTSSKSIDLGFTCSLQSAGNIQEDFKDIQTIMSSMNFSIQRILNYNEIVKREEEEVVDKALFWVPFLIMALVISLVWLLS